MRSFGSLALLVLGGLLVATAAAPQATEVGRQNLHHGTLTALDHSAKTFTIETRTGPQTFTLWEGAEVVAGDQRKSLDALAVGEFVAVRSMQDESERWLARSVEVVDPHEIAGQLEDAPAFDAADTVTITKLDAEAGVLHVQTAQGPRLYQVNEDSRILRGGSEVELATLGENERVVVSARETEPGRFLATTVTVVSVGAAPSDAPAHEAR